MSPYLVSFTVLLIGFNLFSTSSSYAYDPKDHYTEKNVPEVDEHNHEVPDEDSYAVYSLTVPTLYSDHENKEKKPSNNDEESLTPSYYYESCPEFESIVNQKIRSLKEEDETLIPALLRLHFHDCVVRGCDASIMLNHEGSERDAEASKTLRGFEIINEIKGEVEKKCPRTVSCADILTAAARDATTVSNGEYWTVDYGRKDGFVSHAYEADSLVPTGRENMTYLIERFQSLGLDIDDLVALSGAHTIGRSSCGAIQHWLYNKNYTSSSQYSPSINAKYMDYLQRKCRWASDYVDLDAKSPKDFDNEFYVNLVYRKTGLLTTDRLLYSDPRTGYLVKTLAYSPSNFQQQFKKSMINLGNVQVLTGFHEGEVRANCNFVNSHY